MNRPTFNDVEKEYKGYLTPIEMWNQYAIELEKYCDELEQENKKLKKSIDNVAGFLYVHGVGVNLDE